jgi:hypothetical protein
MGRSALAGALSSAAVSACTPLEPGSDIPMLRAFGSADAGVFPLGAAASATGAAAAWSCLSSLERQDTLVRPADAERRWVYSTRALSFLTGQVIPGLSVRACREADVNCDQPLTEARVADADGWVDVPVTEGFTGYFEFTAPTIVPAILVYNELQQNSGSLRNPLAMLEVDAVATLSAALGRPQNASLGLFITTVYDCNGLTAEGIELTHDRGGDPWYLVDGLPSFAARSTAQQGVGGFVNVSPGISAVRMLKDGKPLGTPQSAFIRAGWSTAVVWDPSGTPQ